MPIKLHQLKAFKEVAEKGSIRAASRSLGVSQPALTKNIKELEGALGVSLMNRGSHGVVLTMFGEDFLQHTWLILHELSLAQETIKQQLGMSGGVVRIGMGASMVASSLLPDVFAKFRQTFPLVKINLSEGQVEPHLLRLRQGELDFCINTANPELNGYEFTFEKLLDMEYWIFARKNHPLAKATTLAELANCDWILPEMRSGYHKRVLDLLVREGLNPNVAIYSGSYLASVELLKKTDCLSVFAVEKYNSHEIVALDLDMALPSASYHLIRRKGSPLSPLADRLANLFRQSCRPAYSRFPSDSSET
jgi:LysR family transcriptional regulator of abg operon